jgi:hypothetical protein
MAEKLFMVSVADYYMYDGDQNLLAAGKTLSESTMELAVTSKDVRGGKGAPLQYIYFNSPDMNITLTDTQFNLPFLSMSVGESIANSANVWKEENVTLSAGLVGTVLGTPAGFLGNTTKYAWVSHADGSMERLAFTGQTFTSLTGTSGEVVCARFYESDASAKEITIPANIIPSIITLVLDAQLASSDESTNVVGSVQIVLPKVQLTGGFSLSMTMDGVSTTPLKARALSYEPVGVAGCANQNVFGYIKQVRTLANWYDDVYALAISNADITLTHPATRQLVVKALHESGSPSTPPMADLTFASSVVGKATVGAHTGLITTVATGDTTISVAITAKPSVDAFADVTVS